MVTVVADKVFGRHDHLLAGETTENLGNHLVDWLLVVGLQLILVLSLEQVVGHVKLEADLFIQLQLHNQEGVTSLTLAQRRVKSKHNEGVGVVILREEEELFDGGVLNLVIVCLTAESEG